jgi:hypothetical protein
MHLSVDQLRDAREQVKALVERTADHEQADTIEAVGEALADGITTWEGELVQPKQETFQDVINFENKLSAEFVSLIGSVDGTPPPVTRGARDRLRDLLDEWATHRQTMLQLLDDLSGFNALIQRLGVPPVVLKNEREVRAVS